MTEELPISSAVPKLAEVSVAPCAIRVAVSTPSRPLRGSSTPLAATGIGVGVRPLGVKAPMETRLTAAAAFRPQSGV